MPPTPWTDLGVMLDDILAYQAKTGLAVEPHDIPSSHQLGYRSEDRLWLISWSDATKGFKAVRPDVAQLFCTAEGRRKLVTSSASPQQAFAMAWERFYNPRSAYSDVCLADVRNTFVSILEKTLPQALNHLERWVLAQVSLSPMSKAHLSEAWQDTAEDTQDEFVLPDDDSDYDPDVLALQELVESLPTTGVIVEQPKAFKHVDKAVYDAIDRLLEIGLAEHRDGLLHSIRAS